MLNEPNCNNRTHVNGLVTNPTDNAELNLQRTALAFSRSYCNFDRYGIRTGN